jgi:hypothetical protein
MRVKPVLAFDVCWEVYRGAREVMESKDFALVGQKALEGPDWASRMVLFRLYYLGLAPYENARHFLGLSERSWVNWTEEVRQRCGKELLRRGMFPPRNYFRNAS